MKTTNIVKHLILILSLFCIGAGGAFAAQQPKDELRPYIDEILANLRLETKTVNEQDKVNRIMSVSEKGFDYKEMSRRVLGRYWEGLSKSEQEMLVTDFAQLLKYAYVAKIGSYGNERVEYGEQRVRGKRAQVDTTLIGSDQEIPVSYIMHLDGEHWRVFDIVVEGNSLVRIYIQQFQRIIRKQGYQELSKMLEQKIKEYQEPIAKDAVD